MKRICLAKIATAHGVKGLVKIKVLSDNPQELGNYNFFTSHTDDTNRIQLKMKNSMGKYWLAEIDGITDRTQAEALRNTSLYVNREDLPEIDDEDTYYIEDMIGLDIIDKNGQKTGHILDVQNFGAGDLLEIQPVNGNSFYVPLHDDYIQSIDLENKIVTADIPDDFKET